MTKTTVRIRRPEGHIETVDISDKFPSGLNDKLFAAAKEANAAAGRGECLDYTVVHAPLSAEARKRIDADNEWHRFLDRNDEQSA